MMGTQNDVLGSSLVLPKWQISLRRTFSKSVYFPGPSEGQARYLGGLKLVG
jgi:hypothetical protein